ncbi:unnamed protein product [Agarophyton chilense]
MLSHLIEMMHPRQARIVYTKGFLFRRLIAIAFSLLILFTIATRQQQPQTYSCGDRVPIEEVLRGIHRLQASEQPENEALVLLNQVDQRRKEQIHSTMPFIPYVLHWQSADLLSGPMLLPRSLLTSSLVNRLLVLVDQNHGPIGLYCSVPGNWDIAIHHHLANNYILRPLSQFSIRDRERLLYSPNVYRFLFVRHPLTRLRIMYQNATKHGPDSEAYRSFVSRVRGIPLRENDRVLQVLTPRFFVTFLSRLPILPAEFVSQTELCGRSVIKYHLAGHVESFGRNIVQLNRRLALGGGTFTDLSSLDDSIMHEEWSDKRLRLHVAKLYAEDFRNFGFDVAPPL